MTEVFPLALSLVAMIFAVLAHKRATETQIEMLAQKKSTHTIQWQPVDELKGFSMKDEDFAPITEDQKKILTKDPFGEL